MQANSVTKPNDQASHFMQTSSLKKWILPLLLLVFIITNPSIKAFKNYIGTSSDNNLRRVNNFFLFSIYEYYDERYVGIASNFFELTNRDKERLIYDDPEKTSVPPFTASKKINPETLTAAQKNRKQLFEKLIHDKFYTKSYEAFTEQFSSPEKVAKLHSFLLQKGEYTAGLDAFIEQFFADIFNKNEKLSR